jgi:hypothetical protein
MRTSYLSGLYKLHETMSVTKITVFWAVTPYSLADLMFKRTMLPPGYETATLKLKAAGSSVVTLSGKK